MGQNGHASLLHLYLEYIPRETPPRNPLNHDSLQVCGRLVHHNPKKKMIFDQLLILFLKGKCIPESAQCSSPNFSFKSPKMVAQPARPEPPSTWSPQYKREKSPTRPNKANKSDHMHTGEIVESSSSIMGPYVTLLELFPSLESLLTLFKKDKINFKKKNGLMNCYRKKNRQFAGRSS